MSMVDWHRPFKFRLYSASKPVARQMSPRHFSFLSMLSDAITSLPHSFMSGVDDVPVNF